MTEFLTPVIKGFTDILYPLRKGLSNAENFELLLAKYGWDAPITSGQMNVINTAFAIVPLAESVLEKLDIFVNGLSVDKSSAALELISELKNTISKLGKLDGAGVAGPFPLNQANFWTEISENMFPDLLASYFEKRQPVLYAIFHFAQIFSYEKKHPAGNGRIPYTQTKLDFGKLGAFFTSPSNLFKDNYKWNTPGQDFDHLKLLRTVERILHAFYIQAMVDLPGETIANKFLALNQIGVQNIRELQIPIVDGISTSDNSYWKIGAVLLPIPDPVKGGGKMKGMALIPLLQGDLSTSTYFSNDTYLRLTGAFNADNAVSLQLFPDKVKLDSSLPDAEIKAAFELIGDPEEPWVILGAENSTRLQLGGFKLLLAIAGKISNPETIFSVGTGDSDTNKDPRLSFIFKPDGADSFITKIIGKEGFAVDFQANLRWSSKTGLAFEGQAGFEVELPIHLDLGALEITTLYIAMKGGNAGGVPNAKVDLGVGLKAELGPLTAVVENIGASLALKEVAAGQKGLLGNNDLTFGLKPPNGIGLAINAGAVTGGGYLFFDFEKEEYAGVLELTIAGFIAAKAIGLINPTCQLKHQIFKGIADNEECYFKKEAIWHYRMDGSEHSGLDH